jgi:hypothetical protein
MSKLSEFQETIDKNSESIKAKKEKLKSKVNKIDKTVWWEIGAYLIRTLATAVPAVVIMTLENSWVKSGIGLTATILLIALALIYKEPLKKAMGAAPGVIPFTIFVIIALFFNTTANALLTVGLSGLGGSIVAIPFHYKYTQAQKAKENEDSEEVKVLKTIAEKLNK